MANAERPIRIDLTEPGSDEQRESSTREIRRGLEELGLAVTVVTKPAQPGERSSLELAEIGALIVTLQPTVELITEILRLVNEWRARDKGVRVVRLKRGDRELEIKGADGDDVAKALELFDDE